MSSSTSSQLALPCLAQPRVVPLAPRRPGPSSRVNESPAPGARRSPLDSLHRPIGIPTCTTPPGDRCLPPDLAAIITTTTTIA
ncbi:hypothetical protein K504DRAFT_508616 [Pleomassaria siparia CBS 279.74]|uniref:Uncharacterized protein n=1 Tax=Pleomassaria siparia CBS 279.74 TaxID=1314801 RepID=A0A6G1JQB6_9PLEO|nr:hypothetical protein K504DRAFT_508616 [Pleomassaria siparia CBS 279.74]